MAKQVFVERIREAQELYEIAKGTPHEETCWRYLESVHQIARIANGLQRRSFIANLASVHASAA